MRGYTVAFSSDEEQISIDVDANNIPHARDQAVKKQWGSNAVAIEDGSGMVTIHRRSSVTKPVLQNDQVIGDSKATSLEQIAGPYLIKITFRNE